MTLFDNLLTVFILLVLALIIYVKVTDKNLVDLFRDIKQIMFESGEEVIEYQ